MIRRSRRRRAARPCRPPPTARAAPETLLPRPPIAKLRREHARSLRPRPAASSPCGSLGPLVGAAAIAAGVFIVKAATAVDAAPPLDSPRLDDRTAPRDPARARGNLESGSRASVRAAPAPTTSAPRHAARAPRRAPVAAPLDESRSAILCTPVVCSVSSTARPWPATVAASCCGTSRPADIASRRAASTIGSAAGHRRSADRWAQLRFRRTSARLIGLRNFRTVRKVRTATFDRSGQLM